MQHNIKIVGVGGQGVVTAGIVISEAYRIEGTNVVMSEIHGLSQRGGSVSVDIRTGNVKSPLARYSDIDLLIGFEPLETARYFPVLHDGATVLMSNEKLPPVWLGIRNKEYPDLADLVKSTSSRLNVIEIDAVAMAYKAGNYKSVNSVLLGAAFGLGLLNIQKANFITALKNILGDRGLEINLKAFESGINYANSTENPANQGRGEVNKFAPNPS